MYNKIYIYLHILSGSKSFIKKNRHSFITCIVLFLKYKLTIFQVYQVCDVNNP